MSVTKKKKKKTPSVGKFVAKFEPLNTQRRGGDMKIKQKMELCDHKPRNVKNCQQSQQLADVEWILPDHVNTRGLNF